MVGRTDLKSVLRSSLTFRVSVADLRRVGRGGGGRFHTIMRILSFMRMRKPAGALLPPGDPKK